MPRMGTKKKRAIGKQAPAASPRKGGVISALFSTTLQRVLGCLYGQPERTFFANELITLTGSGSGAVQRELARLVDSGLVTSQTIGRQRHYQANSAAPIYEELRSIVLKTVGLVEPLKSALMPLRKRISRAILYGSIAKGEDRSSSDIDVIIVTDDLTLEQVYAVFEPVERGLLRKVSPTLYSRKDFEKRLEAGNSFLTRVLSSDHVDLIRDDHGSSATR